MCKVGWQIYEVNNWIRISGCRATKKIEKHILLLDIIVYSIANYLTCRSSETSKTNTKIPRT